MPGKHALLSQAHVSRLPRTFFLWAVCVIYNTPLVAYTKFSGTSPSETDFPETDYIFENS